MTHAPHAPADTIEPTVEGATLRFGDGLGVTFMRTLRIPDDGRSYPLPPGLGAFPVRRVDDYLDFTPFSDARSWDFWAEASDWAKHTGVSTGVRPGIFEADRPLTRAEAVTFLWRLMGAPTGFAESGFTDVEVGRFYIDAVNWARATAVTTGVTADRFAPDAPITRAEMATLMWRLAGSAPAGAAGFVDVVPDAFYTEAVGWMALNAITTGTSPTTFSPAAVVDRGQMITFTYRLAGASAAWAVAPPELVRF